MIKSHARKRRRTILGDVAFAALMGAVVALAIAFRIAPDEAMAASPRAAPERPSFLTPIAPFTPMGESVRLARLRTDPEACAAALAQSTLLTQEIADRQSGRCGFTNAVTLTRSSFSYSSPVEASCPLAAAIEPWETAVREAALRHLGADVARIEQMGTYACRRIYHQARGPMSEHATANAIDIAAFTLTDGRTIRVAQHWEGATPEARFLKEVRDRSCGLFSAVLSPDYNAAHADHLHLDMGRARVCR